MSAPRHATTTVWLRAALVGALAAGCLLFLAPASRAATAPSLTLVFTNPSFATLAVDSDGVAYGAPSGSVTQVWRSTDEGRTWTQRSTFPSDYRLYYITPLRSGTLLAAVDTGSFAILRSADGGSSWTRVLTLPGTPCFYSTLTPHSIAEANGFVFVGTYNNCSTGQNSNYIYRSSDDGRTWSTIYTSTTHRHIHGIQYDPGTDALYVLYGDSTGDIERSTDDGASWQPICTTYDDCVGIDIAFGAGFGIYGTDTPFQQNAIERIDLASGRTARVIQLPRVSYSAYALSPSQFLVGTVREGGAAVGDGQLHLYASNDGGQSFSDVYSRSFSPSDNGPNFLQVQYSYPDGDFPIQGSSGTVVARLDGAGIPPPVNTELPSVSGTARQGQTLSASTGTWSGSPTSFAYRWRDCDASGAGCADVGTGSSYLLGSGDVGHTVRVVVTATNGSGSASATSAQTGVVAAGEWSVASSIAVGQVLSGRSAWTATVAGITAGEVASVDFRIDGVSKWTDHLSPYVFNGDGNTLDTTALANGSHTFTVVATATDGTTRSAQAVASVANAVPDPPVNSVLPSVSGTAQQGQTLSASTGTWSGSPTSFAYRWRDCDASGAGCVDIAGATGSSYLLQAADVGHTLRVVVTATNGSGSTPASSAQTGVVAAVAAATNGSAPPPPSGGSGGGGWCWFDGSGGVGGGGFGDRERR